VKQVTYFGDLDPTGIRIALNVAAAAPEGLDVVAARSLYRAALDSGRVRPLTKPARDDLVGVDRWLGQHLGRDVRELWNGGHWIPQEAVTATVLEQIADWR
jgi:hypothetical protein